jgi:4a-hydroxytetrahydrobiopterin dehydratase
MALLPPAKLRASLRALPDWRKRGDAIRREFVFKDFAAAMKFVNRIARLAEKAGHHPDIDIRWNKVTLSLSTHSEGGLTEKDIEFAGKVDGLA